MNVTEKDDQNYVIEEIKRIIKQNPCENAITADDENTTSAVLTNTPGGNDVWD